MIRTLYYSLKIDTYYAINSFIYLLRKLPILKDLFTEDAYTSKILKLLSGFFGILLSFTKMVFSRYLYFLIIYIISNYISKDNRTFYHVFFILNSGFWFFLSFYGKRSMPSLCVLLVTAYPGLDHHHWPSNIFYYIKSISLL